MNTTREFPYDDSMLENKDINVEENNFIDEFCNSIFCKKVLPEETLYYKLTNALKNELFSDYVWIINIKNEKLLTQSEKDNLPDKDLIKNIIEAIYYPTIRNSADGDNFAIKPDVINKGALRFEQVEYIEIIEVIDNRYKYKILDIANIIENDQIRWMNLNNYWTVFDDFEELYFTTEHGVFEAYNRNGDKIEPG